MASEEPVRLLKRGDKKVCEEFVKANYRSLYRWFLWLTNSSHDASDLTQDTFVALWESLDRFREGMPLKPWLYGIARNVWRKRCSRHIEDSIDDPDNAYAETPDPHPNPEQAMINKDAARLLEEAVACLPHDYREAVVLRFWEDMEYSEMAQMLSISQDLARWRVHRGRKLLREKLMQSGIMEEQLVRAGGKMGWWMRVQERPGPPFSLLGDCLATIPASAAPGYEQALDQASIDMESLNGDNRPENLSAVRAGTLDEIREKGCVVVSMDRPVAVFYHEGKVYALDNRCPHMGFPLSRGSVKDGILTCYWHHARFDLSSGCTFDLFADDASPYPVEIREGEVWVFPRSPVDEVAHWRHRLKEGIEMNIGLVTAKAVIALLHHEVESRSIVRQGALFATCYQDNWADGLTILTAMANMLPYLQGDEKVLALWHGLIRAARNVYGQSPRWDRQPLATGDVPLATLKRWLRHWVSVRHRDGAERCLLTALYNGASPGEVADLLFSAATDRIFADGGHVLDFINKAFEMLDLIGWEHASEVLPALLAQLTSATGAEESSEWRHPMNLVAMLKAVSEELPALLKEGERNRKGKDRFEPCDEDLVYVLLASSPTDIVHALKDSIRSGFPPAEIGKHLAYASAMRICRFGTGNESGDWITVLHTFTYCNALHQALKRTCSPELVRGIFHGAMRVYLDYFLNIPPAPLPEERSFPSESPSDGGDLLRLFLNTLDRQAQVNEAGCIVARYLSLGHPAEPLIRTLTFAVVREDADFHTYQMLEAAVRQHKEWAGAEQARHILIAAARYLAAWSPTRRSLLQTANAALRLHRGATLYEPQESENRS